MKTLNEVLPPRSVAAGKEIIVKIVKYQSLDEEEQLIIHPIKGLDYNADLIFPVTRTAGDLISSMYPVHAYGIAVLHGKEMRLVDMDYTVLGYNGNEFAARSWLPQPMVGKITKGTDWYSI
jgi:hypothetical protein